MKIGEVLGEIMELKRRVAAKEVGEGGCLESGADMKKSGAMKWVVEPEEIKGWENGWFEFLCLIILMNY